MIKILLFAFTTVISFAQAQNTQAPMNIVTSDPTGVGCSTYDPPRIYQGKYFGCDSGTSQFKQTACGSTGQVLTNSSNVCAGVATTGSGSVVLATSATLVTPNLGVPSAIDLTNATSLPYGIFQSYFNGGAHTVAAGDSEYYPLNGTLNNYNIESLVQFKANSSGSLKNFCMQLYTGTQPASGSLVATVRVNSANTAATVSLAASGSGGVTICDTTHTITIAANDLINILVKNNASAGSVPILGLLGQIYLK